MNLPHSLDEAADLAATVLERGDGPEDLRHLRHGLERLRADIGRRNGCWRAGPLAEGALGVKTAHEWGVVARRFDHSIKTLAAAEIVCGAALGLRPTEE
ncbi:MAG: hypothetical protein HY985_03200 [Magnetospirillum sp.]|nr:hypothetical protein [Magnetospirillum sp.]